MNSLPDIAGLLSFFVSAWALWTSNNAKKAATKVLARRDEQDNLDKIIRLVFELKKAKESVTIWMPGMPPVRQQGRDRREDLAALFIAADSLRTNPPLEADEDLQREINGSADKLDDLAQEIRGDIKNEDLWKSAQLELSYIINVLEKTVRIMKNRLAGE